MQLKAIGFSIRTSFFYQGKGKTYVLQPLFLQFGNQLNDFLFFSENIWLTRYEVTIKVTFCLERR